MKKEQLQKVLRPIIKEEVAKVVADVLPGLLAEGMAILQEQQQFTSVKKPSSPVQKQSLMDMIDPGRKNIPKQSERRFSNDPLLNEILSQTTGLNASEGMSPAAMMAEQYEGNNIQQMMYENPYQDLGPMEDYQPQTVKPEFYNKFNAQAAAMLPQHDTSGGANTVTAEQLAEQAPEVLGALTKDYRSMMKAVDAKKRQSGPSNIDFSKGV
jgi:DnaJ-domain-containing protein 1